MDSDSLDEFPVRDSGGHKKSLLDDKVSEQKRAQQRRAVATISREELEDRYLRLHDENLILKRHGRKQEEKIKRMATKLLRLAQENKGLKDKDGGTGGTSGAGPRRTRGRDIETEELLEEQQQQIRDLEKQCDAYKNKLMVTKQQLATQSQRKTPYTHVQSRINTGVPKPPTDSVRKGLRVQGERTRSATPRSMRNDVLPRYGHSLLEDARAENQRLNEELDGMQEHIHMLEQEREMLSEQIRIKGLDHEEVLLRLKEQMSAGQRSNIQENVDMIRLQREVKEKSQKLAALEAQYATLQENLATVKTSHDAVIEEMEDLNRKLQREQAKSLSLMTELKHGSTLQRNVGELQERIADTEREKDILREANEKLLNSAFDAERERQYRANEKQLKLQIAQLEATLKGDLNDKNTLLDKLNEEREHYEGMQKENREMQVKYYAVRQQLEELQEKMRFFTKESTVDWAEMEEALIIVKKRKERGTHDLDFLEKVEDVVNQDLKMQIASLQADYAETVNELEKTRNMLLLQNKINRDYKSEVESSTSRLEDYKQEYETKLDEYAQLLDIRAARIKKLERQMKDIAYGTKQFKVADIAPEEDDYEEVDESVKLERGQNLMEIHIERMIFSKEGLRELGDDEPSTFATYEFFEFELQSTPVVKGDKPVFSFTSQYRVIVDDFYLHHLMKGATTLEVHQAIGTEYRTVAACQLRFRDLLDKPQGRVHGTAQLVGVEAGRTDVIYGSVEFWVRLRVPMDQALRLFRERVKALGYMTSNQRATQQALTQLNKTQEENQTPERDENINELTVRVVRCNDVKARRDGVQPNPYVVYRFFDFNDHDTTIVYSSNAPEINDTQTYPVPITPDLDKYLRTETVDFYVFDDTDPEDTSYLGVAKVPLISLANNKAIKGTFELKQGEETNGTIDLLLKWQYTYTAPKALPHTAKKVLKPSVQVSSTPKPPPTRPPSGRPSAPQGKPPHPSPVPQPRRPDSKGLDMTPVREKPPIAHSTPTPVPAERRGSRDRKGSAPPLPQVQEDKEEVTSDGQSDAAKEEEEFVNPTPPRISVTPPPPLQAKDEPKMRGGKLPGIARDDQEEEEEIAPHQPEPAPGPGDSFNDLERELTGELERQKREEEEERERERERQLGAETPAVDNSLDDGDLVAQEMEREFRENNATQMGKTEVYEDTMFGDPPDPDQNDFDESSSEDDVVIPGAGHEEEEEDEGVVEEEEEETRGGGGGAVSAASSDSEGVVMPTSTNRPMSVMANEDLIKINLGVLNIEPNADLIEDDSIHNLFIEYQIRGVPQEELETPFSLPKPKPNGNFLLNYNFYTAIHCDAETHFEVRDYLASLLKADHPDQGRFQFTVVNDPADDEEGQCEDIGHAYINLQDILAEGRDLVESEREVFSVKDESVVIGSMTVSVECVAALRAIHQEMQTVPEEEGREDEDLETDEEL